MLVLCRGGKKLGGARVFYCLDNSLSQRMSHSSVHTAMMMIFNILYISPIALFTPPTWWWWSQWWTLDRVFNFAIGICNAQKGRGHERNPFFVDPSETITNTIILGHHAHNENATNGLENLRWTSFLPNGMIMKMVVAWFRAFALIWRNH